MASYAPLEASQLRSAFQALDRLLERPVNLVVGGGTAMMLAYGLPVRTMDVDAYPRDGRLDEILPVVRAIAKEHGLPPDWINPWFETFAYVLPSDYGARLRPVFHGERLEVEALGVEDLLVMKCFAGREKDVGHARALLRRGPDLGIVERRLQELGERGVTGAQDALDFFDDLTEGSQ
jgi:predicted nucleotidyltransferase